MQLDYLKKMMTINLLLLVFFIVLQQEVDGYFGVAEDQHCFCQLEGRIDDCTCSIDTVDHFNNVKIYPRLRSLLTKDYFRFYKVNLKQNCPFWVDDSRCAIRYCHVEACKETDIPAGLKGAVEQSNEIYKGVSRYSKETNCENDYDKELGYLNTTLSMQAKEEFERWQEYDDAQDNFCVVTEDVDGSEYVDLLLNPERYTGYKGYSAHRIWNSIYMENCFRPDNTRNPYIDSKLLNGMCLEKRVFYRVVSGLHSSINIHLCANYLQSDKGINLAAPNGEWGPNLDEFIRRFSPDNTNGEGPNWLRNLYFIYLLELRALAKASTYLEHEEYYTGSDTEDWDTQLAVQDLLNVIKSFQHHFNESIMFNGGEAIKMKNEFKQHFRNISRIMDCVGCDKCKLWGKLQVQGLGTALKILFSDKFQEAPSIPYKKPTNNKKHFQLQRSEIVSLINAIGRLSTSIYELDEFRLMLR